MNQEIFNETLQQLKSIADGINNPWTVWFPCWVFL